MYPDHQLEAILRIPSRKKYEARKDSIGINKTNITLESKTEQNGVYS